jgi:ABC-type multidrug transport system ATPase subunit
MSKTAIRTEKLTRDFGQIRAVDDLSLEIPAGIVFGFLGPNGSGKTTTIRLLLGLLDPARGRAEVLVKAPWARSRRSVSIARLVGQRPELRIAQSARGLQTAADFVADCFEAGGAATKNRRRSDGLLRDQSRLRPLL